MTARARGSRLAGHALLAALFLSAVCDAQTGAAAISGAGATFPGPLYRSWAVQYRVAAGVEVRYDPLGSGLGLERVRRGEVDFGASDAPLTAAEQAGDQLLQFPVVIGGVLPVINITGIRPGEMRLTGAVLAAIYLGRVRRWNDPAIAALNPSLHLPGSNITVVHRDDASGSSLLWTSYLSQQSEEWRRRVGAGTTSAWPAGVGARGNEGVASYVQRTRYAIGYVEFYFARAHGLSDVTLRNHDGQFVRARPENFASAAAGAAWGEGEEMRQLPTDAPGALSWPVTGASFILVPRMARDATRQRAVLRFFDWALHDGARQVEQLEYTPLPQQVIDRLPALWQSLRDSAGRPVWP